MIYLFNKKIPYDEVAILEELLRILITLDDYDIELKYPCESIGGIVSRFLAKRSMHINSYTCKMWSFLPTLGRTQTLGFILSRDIWETTFNNLSRQEAINRIQYFIEYGIPYRLFFFRRLNIVDWYKTNKYINEHSK